MTHNLPAALPFLVVLLASAPSRADEASDREFFEQRIRPVLVRHCYECHATVSVAVKGGLLLDSRDNLRRGGESGPVIVPVRRRRF
jgi:hypothetical protein